MIIETFITKFLRYQNQHYLTFDDFTVQKLPCGHREREYLLYVHIPFCEELCPYCSFNRYKFQDKRARRYFTALRREIKLYSERDFKCTGVYVGGGTPTVLPEDLAGTLQLVRECFPVREVSVETNPNHLTDEVVTILRQAGGNRLSVWINNLSK